MNLREIQHRMFMAVVQPLTIGEKMQPRTRAGKSMHEEAAEFIKPNDRLSSFERLEIYNRQYWFRVLSSLEEDFPGLRAVIGNRRFESLCKAYLADCPSASFTLRNLGARLESWLQSHSQYIRPRELALDMARLEWAEIEAYDASAEPVLTPQDLLHLGADPQLRLQPYIRLLKLSYPVDDLLVAVRRNDASGAMTSNAVSQVQKRVRVPKIKQPKSLPIFLAVHRIDNSAFLKRLSKEAFGFLTAIQEGKTLTAAVAAAFEGGNAPEAEVLATVQAWFEFWSELGWFCRPF